MYCLLLQISDANLLVTLRVPVLELPRKVNIFVLETFYLKGSTERFIKAIIFCCAVLRGLTKRNNKKQLCKNSRKKYITTERNDASSKVALPA